MLETKGLSEVFPANHWPGGRWPDRGLFDFCQKSFDLPLEVG